jgi:hypothetical protein
VQGECATRGVERVYLNRYARELHAGLSEIQLQLRRRVRRFRPGLYGSFTKQAEDYETTT